MKVNISVCGKFHYTNYLKFISAAGVLNKFYYSHKLSTGSTYIGVESSKLHNLFLKEYLTFFHTKFLRGYHFQKWIIPYQNLWQRQLLSLWEPCDILHTLNHGSSVKVIAKAKEQGSVILGEQVNSSPESMFDLIREEHDRLNIPYYQRMPATLVRMEEEEKYFDYFLTPSDFVAKSYLRKGISSDRIFTVPFGVDLSKFKFKNYEKDKFRVIYVAQITPRKAHIDLLKAWLQLNLHPSKAELVFVGSIDPVMRPLLDKYQGKFTYAGILSVTELIELYNSSSVFVMPSVEEGCSYAPLEAMACGLPVILTENTGSGERVTHGKEGFIVPIRSPDQIATYIELLYKDEEMRTTMGKHALAKASEDFGWDIYAKRILEIYELIDHG